MLPVEPDTHHTCAAQDDGNCAAGQCVCAGVSSAGQSVKDQSTQLPLRGYFSLTVPTDASNDHPEKWLLIQLQKATLERKMLKSTKLKEIMDSKSMYLRLALIFLLSG